MAKKRKKTAEDIAFDERTKMIREFIDRRWAGHRAKKAADEPRSQNG